LPTPTTTGIIERFPAGQAFRGLSLQGIVISRQPKDSLLK
jgi:hypothetical protein